MAAPWDPAVENEPQLYLSDCSVHSLFITQPSKCKGQPGIGLDTPSTINRAASIAEDNWTFKQGHGHTAVYSAEWKCA